MGRDGAVACLRLPRRPVVPHQRLMRDEKLPLLRLRPPEARWWLVPERPGRRGGAGAARACAGRCTSMRLRRSSFKERSCQSGAGWQ
jgi:hypothetical protein